MEQLNYEGEIWLPIENASNFMVSNLGRVKSIGRKIRYEHAKTRQEHFRQTSDVILKEFESKYRYKTVLIRCDDGIKRNLMTHRLVAKAFIPNPDNLPVVNHKDGNRSNNHVDNLEWCTIQYNSQHSMKIGTSKFGSNHTVSKLNETLVELLKIKMALGFTISELSYEYNIQHATLSLIKSEKQWKHVVIPDGIIPIKRDKSFHCGIPIAQVNIDGTIVRKFPSIKSAAEFFGIDVASIQRRLENPLYNAKDGLNFRKLDFEETITKDMLEEVQ